ncbi:transcription antitermination factor NusB [Deinococcus cellulosilyticus]|uniref:16S rRNA m5C967 methyltransferase n=1 Tax=Deinococcus cellulosilyticus (strain DSM 18568 / NBRC 106333 / KACC 11606 / 5516J-15) TaxID=1223518 RepID=A0A511N5T7_DEIC1|nr:transcription antitermination factor NusB [Deinococcus cellulosilyticus]GEM47838.1 16S rRNA m5C967 methyltransferase [Deinococcus cellulosilyticus NBRC 106333 = KACC 11606]
MSSVNPARTFAVRILKQVLDGAYAAPLLDQALNAKISSSDAGLMTHLVYGTLRHAQTLEKALLPLLNKKPQRETWVILLLGAFEKLILETPPHAVVNEYTEIAKKHSPRLGGLVNAVLRKVQLPEETTYSLPDWLLEEYKKAYPEQWEAVVEDLLQPSPLWLWLSDKGVRQLEEEEALVEPGIGQIDKVVLSRSLRKTKAYQKGQAQPINPASYSVIEALGEVMNREVLDLAGGTGIKAAFLAKKGARVTSVDLDPRKAEQGRQNAERLGQKVTFKTADLRSPENLGTYSKVLLDAPCTGSGTLRTHPEIKLRITPEYAQEMSDLQKTLLEESSKFVADGGELVYSVCSVLPQESEEVIVEFLKNHPEFQAQAPDLSVPSVKTAVGTRTVPVNGVDGFFVSRLVKVQ